MAKASRKLRRSGHTKKEQLDATIAEVVGAGRELHLESVDFTDLQRPKTCLEVDFPILPVNHVAGPEMSSGAAKKPIYTWQKWWARRSSHVFRATLIAAATKAPDDPAEAAKLVWDSFYGNHQKNEAFKNLKVADIFMGGGTTVVEGARLGMHMYGNDLNPVAWFVVKNELALVEHSEVENLLDLIERDVKPQIMPFYACECPRGHKGKWLNKKTRKVMEPDFDALAMTSQERTDYEYEGPEIIYTFWAKHGPCQATGCGHRTPIMSSPVIAVKKLMVKAWKDIECSSCRKQFDIEEQEARMAPLASFVISPDEVPFTVRHGDGSCSCPHCGHNAAPALGPPKNKTVCLTLLIHPDWLKGSPSKSADGTPHGGSVTDNAQSTTAWSANRHRSLKHIEVRGPLPREVMCPDTKQVFNTDTGTVPKRSTFTCMESTCGKQWDVLEAVRATKTTGPMAPYAIQGYCSVCDKHNQPYSGRFFSIPNQPALDAAHREWEARREADLAAYWPRGEVPYGFMTSLMNGGIPNHGHTHWWTMFNPLQLLIHAQILHSIDRHRQSVAADVALGVWQKYVQHDCMMCFWDQQQDCLAPHFSNNNYHPKSTPVSNNPFTKLGRGNWQSSVTTLREAREWFETPWDLVRGDLFEHLGVSSKTFKLPIGDSPRPGVTLECHSATECRSLAAQSHDLVITDPPFGGLLHYSELADFYYVWLRLVLHNKYPDKFSSELTPKALEAVANRARQPDDSDAFYQKVLTECWKEVGRILKPSGILAFTFHHSEDEPWVAVLESLFDAGFYLEATYPIRSDETKGEGEFGSRKIEFDIIHVCRKRVDDPQEISWARLRRQILQDVQQLRDLLEHHQEAGVQEADLQVIRRGKALEYFSKHYGKVYVEKGREFTVREALAGINQLLDDQQDAIAEVPPVDAEPYTRQFLRLFADTASVPRDQMQKYLRGTGVSPAEFEERGWCKENKKVFQLASPLTLAQEWKGKPRQGMGRDFDQAIFLIGACFENSGIRVYDTLNSEQFKPHIATGPILEWFTRHAGDTQTRDAAKLASQIYITWEASNQPKVRAAQKTFDFLETE